MTHSKIKRTTKNNFKRKKSSRVRNTLAFGTIALMSTIISSCNNSTNRVRIFKTIEDCRRAGYKGFVCKRQYNQAFMRHLRNRPCYKTAAECKRVFGTRHCEQIEQSRSGRSFVPLMTGFMMDRSLRNVYTKYTYNRWKRNHSSYSPEPIYRSRSGDQVIAHQSQLRGPSKVRLVNVKTQTLTRYGFGRYSNTHRSWGS